MVNLARSKSTKSDRSLFWMRIEARRRRHLSVDSSSIVASSRSKMAFIAYSVLKYLFNVMILSESWKTSIEEASSVRTGI